MIPQGYVVCCLFGTNTWIPTDAVYWVFKNIKISETSKLIEASIILKAYWRRGLQIKIRYWRSWWNNATRATCTLERQEERNIRVIHKCTDEYNRREGQGGKGQNRKKGFIIDLCFMDLLPILELGLLLLSQSNRTNGHLSTTVDSLLLTSPQLQRPLTRVPYYQNNLAAIFYCKLDS